MGLFDRFKKRNKEQPIRPPSPNGEYLESNESTPKGKLRPDRTNSKAHLLLLTKFIHTRPSVDLTKHLDWVNLLGEPPQRAMQRFIDDGLLASPNLSGLLSYRYKVTELKEMLKQRGLAVSGRKDEMIERLVLADTDAMKKAVAGMALLECTARGREMAESYLDAERGNRLRVEREVLDYLARREYENASLAVATYEAEQVVPRGIGADWKSHNPKHDVERLTVIFNGKPKLLTGLDESKLQAIRAAAAMMYLWGENEATQWLPSDFETGLSFDNDVAARMVLYHAQHSATVNQYRDTGIVGYVEIIATPDSCESCKKLANKRYKLNEAPELPNEECTHEMGCRCVRIPVVE